MKKYLFYITILLISFNSSAQINVNAGNDTTICLSMPLVKLNGLYTKNQTIYRIETIEDSIDKNIPDNSSSRVVKSFYFPFENYVVNKICLIINHSWNEDLDIVLINPFGNSIDISSDNGGNGDNYDNVCFDRKSPKNINSLSHVDSTIKGNWLPEQSFSNLDSFSSKGTWSLVVSDDSMFIAGELIFCYISFQPINLPTIIWSPTTYLSDSSVLNPDFINPMVAGIYTYVLSVTDSNNTNSDSIIIAVKAENNPIAGFNSIINNFDVNFINTSIDATNFLWAFGDGINDTNKNSMHSYLSHGVYNVILIAKNDCGADTIKQIIDLAVGIDEKSEQMLQQTKWSVYYSPEQKKIKIFFSSELVNSDVSAELLDIHGRNIATIPLRSGENIFQYDATKLKPGVYLVRVKSEAGAEVRRVVVY